MSAIKAILLAVHDRQIAEHGGGQGIRDEGLLESAINRPVNLAGYGKPAAADLAAAYATLANGGRRISPTLVHSEDPEVIASRFGPQVVEPHIAEESLKMMRAVVTRGTASFGEVKGYEVAAKTGSADKVKPTGGYYKDKVIGTFAGMFPASDPEYVLVLTLDEAVETSGPIPRRTAGWTAVPVAAEVIRRTAPVLGLRPIESLEGITLVNN